jgi:cell shape-determining protein MreC
VGDKLITAGVGGIYPKGIKVGMITNIAKENFGMTLSVEVVPSVDFDKLEEVLVLIPVEGVQAEVAPVVTPAVAPAAATVIEKKEVKI